MVVPRPPARPSPRWRSARGGPAPSPLPRGIARGELAVALDVLLRRLPNLRLLEEPRITGAILRGPRSLEVVWDAP
jgi:hypothetical protein